MHLDAQFALSSFQHLLSLPPGILASPQSSRSSSSVPTVTYLAFHLTTWGSSQREGLCATPSARGARLKASQRQVVQLFDATKPRLSTVTVPAVESDVGKGKMVHVRAFRLKKIGTMD